jgi:LacI family transcriptional regulator
MFEKRHRITLLFNANKAYDRQVVEGVGEYLQASQLEWDIFIEEDFRARIENIKEWLAMALSPTMTIPKLKTCWPTSTSRSSASAALPPPECYPPVHYIATDNAALVESAFCI